MKYENIRNFSQRCEEHPDHQTGMISHQMLLDRAHEEIDELREYIEQAQKQEPVEWRTFDGEGNYEYRDYDMNENYDKEWADRNPNHAHWVQPLIVKE
jgi:hypothetical protein